MKKQSAQDKYFRTQDFYLAAFLYAKGLALVNAEEIGTKKLEFVFEERPERGIWQEARAYGAKNDPDAVIDVRKHEEAIKRLKDIIHNNPFI